MRRSSQCSDHGGGRHAAGPARGTATGEPPLPGVMSEDDRLTLTWGPVTIPARHPLYTAPCLMCCNWAGAGIVVVVLLADLGLPATPGGQVERACYLVHQDCMPAETLKIHHAAHRRASRPPAAAPQVQP